MKKYFIALFLSIILTMACTQTRAENNKSVEAGVETTNYEIIVVDNTLEDPAIIIGGHRTKYTSRDISDTFFIITIGEGESADFSGIEQFQNTRHLRLRLLDIRDLDFSPLRSLPYLESMFILGWGLATFPDLDGIPSLIGLDIDFGRLTNLNGIEKIPSLERLVISENRMPLTDMSALRYLRNLKSLHLYSGFYTIDFSVLEDLLKLKELWIGAGGEVDLTGISQAKSIEKLILQSNVSRNMDERSVYKNIAEIGKMTELKELHLDESISSVEYLADNVNLERLELIADMERMDYGEVLLPLDVKPLGNLTKLKYLAIRGFELTNADVLEGLPRLKYFSTRSSPHDH